MQCSHLTLWNRNEPGYGKQIGHLAEALEVLIQKLKILDRTDLSEDDRDALQVFLGDVAAIRQIKSGHE